MDRWTNSKKGWNQHEDKIVEMKEIIKEQEERDRKSRLEKQREDKAPKSTSRGTLLTKTDVS